MAAVTSQPGLRERKKLRTKRTIVEVATRLFLEHGYHRTTLAQIAEAAELAPSTFFNYFATKHDIVFCLHDAATESARRRVLGRPQGEPANEAVMAWLTEELPGLELPYAEAARRIPRIVAATPELHAEERLRLALLEDVLADGFARDLDGPGSGIRARLLGVIAVRGMVEAWNAWYEQHATEPEFELTHALAAKAAYVERMLEAGYRFVDMLPDFPPGD
jgi:AcrR family transcriptional regulator